MPIQSTRGRHSLGLLIAMLAALCAPAWSADPATKSEARPTGNLKLLTWNIQMLPTFAFGSRSVNKMQSLRAPWIIEFLNGQDYDIVCLQEVIDRKITEELKQELKRKYPYIVAPESKKGIAGSTGGILFVSKIPIKYVAHIVYKNVTGVDAIAEKGCVLIEAEVDGLRIQVAGTHLQAGHNEVKEKEFPEIYEGIVKPHAHDGVPQFLVGDMNVASDVPSEKSRYELLLRTTDMRDFPTDDPQPYSIDAHNSWSGPRKQPQKIDHVLLNPRGTQTTVVRQSIQRARREHEGKVIDLADHYGVVAEILVRK